MTVLVIGASRGIGLEFVRQYRDLGQRVVGTARDNEGLARLRELGAQPLKIDVTEAASGGALRRHLDGERIDTALYVAGVYTRGGATEAPEQDEFDRTMRTNVLGAMRIIPWVAPLVEAAHGKFLFISSEMGYISGVDSSFGWVYRVSKAALNMAVAAAQNDFPDATMVTINPGWVRTEMGGYEAPMDVDQSVTLMRRTIEGLTRRHRGNFLNYDGRRYKGF